MKALLLALLVVVIIVFGPMILLWAINVLLCEHWVIPYTFKTWFAVLLVGGMFSSSGK